MMHEENEFNKEIETINHQKSKIQSKNILNEIKNLIGSFNTTFNHTKESEA